MDLRIEDDGRILLVSVVGVDSLDASNSMTLRSEFEKKVGKSRAVILSMASVQSIDSSGIGALVAVLKEIRKRGEHFALIDVNPRVYSVLEMIRLTTVFEILPDEAAARAAIASPLA